MGKTEIKVKYDKEWGEWKVVVLQDGCVNESLSYYTDDRDDANATAKIMRDNLK